MLDGTPARGSGTQPPLPASRFLSLARKVNNFLLQDGPLSCTPLVISGCQVGLIEGPVLQELQKHPSVFRCFNDLVQLNPALCDYEQRSNVLDALLRQWREQDRFPTLRGWRDECFEVKWSLEQPSLLKMERSATCIFGIRQYGVTINGYVNHPQRGLCLWLQKRSSTKQTWPGMFDNMVGGGLSVGYNVLDTARKEAAEEAGVSETLLQNLKDSGSVTFFFQSERGLFPNTEFIFDLELPPSFRPRNQDGEVQSFHLLSVQEVCEAVLGADFKTTSCPVVLHFLIRHGILTQQNEPGLDEIRRLLDVPLDTHYRELQPAH